MCSYGWKQKKQQWIHPILSILTVFLLQVDQPSPGITLSTWCPTREGPVEAWTKLDHGQCFLLRILLMLLFSAVV